MVQPLPKFKDIDDEYEYFRVKKSEMWNMWGYEKFIKRHLKNRSHVPARVFRRYMKFYEWNEEQRETFYKKIIAERKTMVVDYFKDDKDYYFVNHRLIDKPDFSGIKWLKNPFEEKVQKPQPKSRPVSTTKKVEQWYKFEWMIDNVVEEVGEFLIKNVDTRADKSQFLHQCHNAIVTYINRYFTDKEKKNYKTYKIRVIAGYMAMCFGYEISHSPIKNKRDIYNAVKYTFDKK